MIVKLESKERADITIMISLDIERAHNYAQATVTGVTVEKKAGSKTIGPQPTVKERTTTIEVSGKAEINRTAAGFNLDGEVIYDYEEGLLYEFSGEVQIKEQIKETVSGKSEVWFWTGGKETLTDREETGKRMACMKDGTFRIGGNFDALVTVGEKAYRYSVYQPSMSIPKLTNPPEIYMDTTECGQTAVVTIAKDGQLRKAAYAIGAAEGDIAEMTERGTIPWEVPIELAQQMPDSFTGDVALTVKQYASPADFIADTVKSEAVENYHLTVPDYTYDLAKRVNISDPTGVWKLYGAPVIGKSVIQIDTQIEGIFGASIKEIKATCGKLTAYGSTTKFIPNEVPDSIMVAIADSRGKKAEVSLLVWKFYLYRNPEAAILRAERVDHDGNPNPEGSKAAVTVSGSTASFGLMKKNKAEYELRIRRRGETYWSEVIKLDALRNQHEVSDYSMTILTDIDSAFEVCFAAIDDFEETPSYVATIPVAFCLMDFDRNMRSVGIGQRAEHEKTLCVGMPIDMHAHRVMDCGEPEADSDAATKGYVDSMLAALRRELGM